MTETPLRIGILMPNLHWHGGSQVALTLAEALQEGGAEVEIAVVESVARALPGRPQPSMTTQYLEASSLRRAVPRTRRWASGRRLDVLLAIGDWASMIAGLACTALRHRPRLVIGSEHFPISAKFGDFPHLRGRVLGHLMRLGYRNLDATVCVNEDLHARMVAELGWAPGDCPVIHNPVRLTPIDPQVCSTLAEARRRKGEYVVVAAGALQPRKDLPTLLRAFALASTELPMRLRVAGTGEMLADLQDLGDQLGITARLEFLGAVEDMEGLLRNADLFAFTSTQEAFGLVLVEALSQGVPVVSTDCRSGPSEIITDGVHGRLVPVGDTDTFARAMLEVLRRPPAAGTLIARARDFEPAGIAARYRATFADRLHQAVDPGGDR